MEGLDRSGRRQHPTNIRRLLPPPRPTSPGRTPCSSSLYRATGYPRSRGSATAASSRTSDCQGSCDRKPGHALAGKPRESRDACLGVQQAPSCSHSCRGTSRRSSQSPAPRGQRTPRDELKSRYALQRITRLSPWRPGRRRFCCSPRGCRRTSSAADQDVGVESKKDRWRDASVANWSSGEPGVTSKGRATEEVAR